MIHDVCERKRHILCREVQMMHMFLSLSNLRGKVKRYVSLSSMHDWACEWTKKERRKHSFIIYEGYTFKFLNVDNLWIKQHIAITLYLHMLHVHSLFLEDLSFLWPPRIREICRPLLNAWLKSILVWNSDTKGNHAKNATGVNRSSPITISYPRASVLTEDHIPRWWIRGLQACAIRSIPHPVGMKASMQMNKSLTVIRGSARRVMRTVTNAKNTRPFIILNRSWKLVLNLLLPIPKPFTMSRSNKMTNHEAP